MNIFDFFRLRNKTAARAKERLQIVVSHQRNNDKEGDFLPQLRHELLKVIGKYVEIDEELINVQLQREGNCSILELNVTLPDEVAEVASP